MKCVIKSTPPKVSFLLFKYSSVVCQLYNVHSYTTTFPSDRRQMIKRGRRYTKLLYNHYTCSPLNLFFPQRQLLDQPRRCFQRTTAPTGLVVTSIEQGWRACQSRLWPRPRTSSSERATSEDAPTTISCSLFLACTGTILRSQLFIREYVVVAR